MRLSMRSHNRCTPVARERSQKAHRSTFFTLKLCPHPMIKISRWGMLFADFIFVCKRSEEGMPDSDRYTELE